MDNKLVFISYSSKEKELVQNVVSSISKTIPSERIVFDEFNLKAGDSIIGFMNDALANYSYYLFFVSKNSLESYMCSLEWKNALILAKDKNRKFVPILIDECAIPAILLDFKYIDLYGKGIEFTLNEIRKVLFLEKEEIIKTTNNLFAKVFIQNNILEVVIGCNFCVEANSSFCIAIGSNDINDVKLKDFESFNGSEEIIELDGKDRKCFFIRPFRSLTPGNSMKTTFSFIEKIDYLKIMQVNGNEGTPIEIV